MSAGGTGGGERDHQRSQQAGHPVSAAGRQGGGEGCFYLDLIVWLNGDQIELGNRVGFNYGCYVNGYGGLIIGDDSNVGPLSMIHTANHNYDDLSRPILEQGHTKRPVRIGSGCWIGMGCVILPGVTIADGVIVGGGSVVPNDLTDPYTIAVGNPARVIKSRR
jgi:maltose O-acetyltransferase